MKIIGDFCGNCGTKKLPFKQSVGTKESGLGEPTHEKGRTANQAIAEDLRQPTPLMSSTAKDNYYSDGTYQTQKEQMAKTSISFKTKLLAPIIFDKITIKFIGNDEMGTSNALILFIVNYYFFVTSPIWGYGTSGWIHFDTGFLFIASLLLVFLLLSLRIIAWSYALVLRSVKAHHKPAEIFRLACYTILLS